MGKFSEIKMDHVLSPRNGGIIEAITRAYQNLLLMVATRGGGSVRD